MNGLFPGMGGIDPSKLSPQAIAELSELMSTLSMDQMMKMQTLMHNAMGGFDITKDMAEFEKSLPSSFREKMARIAYMANGIEVPAKSGSPTVATSAAPLENPTNMNEARLVILRSVASGLMPAEEALRVLFPE